MSMETVDDIHILKLNLFKSDSKLYCPHGFGSSFWNMKLFCSLMLFLKYQICNIFCATSTTLPFPKQASL